MDGERQHELVFPDRDGCQDAGLDLFRQGLVVALDHADLRSCLQGDGARQAQIVQAPLKTVQAFCKVVHLLGVQGVAALPGLSLDTGQLLLASLLQTSLSCHDGCREVLVEGLVVAVELFQNLNVLEQAEHGVFKMGAYALHLIEQGVEAGECLFNRSKEAADKGDGGKNTLPGARYFRDIYVLDLEHELLQGVAHGTCVLYAHIAKKIVCKLGNLVHGL